MNIACNSIQLTFIAIGVGLCLQSAAAAKEQGPETQLLDRIDIEQKIGDQIPADLTFLDEHGDAVLLEKYLGEKPVVLHFVYFECPMLCNLTSDGLVKTIEMMDFQPGTEFTVLTVSFDERERPQQAAGKKAVLIDRLGNPDAGSGWHFLTGDRESIRRLTDAAGFRFVWDPKAGRYAHPAGIIVLTPEGRVSRYLNGIEYQPRDLRLALVEASQNKLGTVTDQVLLYCYHYDPATGKYGLTIMRVIRAAGAATVIGLAAGIYFLSRKYRKSDHRDESPDKVTPQTMES